MDHHIAADHTKTEMDQYKKLRTELDERTKKGEIGLEIRKGKIVKK